jgi:hypothetical protein
MTAPWIVGFCALAVLVLVLAVLVLGLLKRILPVLEELGERATTRPEEGPPVGSSLTDLPIADPRGLLFVSARCDPCQQLIAEMQHCDPTTLAGLVVVADSAEIALPTGLELAIQADRRLARELRLSSTPYALAVGPDNTLTAKGVVNTVAQLQALLAS